MPGPPSVAQPSQASLTHADDVQESCTEQAPPVAVKAQPETRVRSSSMVGRRQSSWPPQVRPSQNCWATGNLREGPLVRIQVNPVEPTVTVPSQLSVRSPDVAPTQVPLVQEHAGSQLPQTPPHPSSPQDFPEQLGVHPQ